MKRPMCPLCKDEHFAREPHVFKKTPEQVTEPVVVVRPKEPVLGARFDRNAYQREYMRKWRAK